MTDDADDGGRRKVDEEDEVDLCEVLNDEEASVGEELDIVEDDEDFFTTLESDCFFA